MAKPRSVDAKLKRLQALRREAAAPAHVGELRQHFQDKSSFVVAEAAEIVSERNLSDLAPDLVAAFQRFLVDPVATDKLCRAKLAIVEALNKIEYDEEDLFLAAVRYVQLEPRWGPAEDTAATLRGSAAFGLVRLRHRDVLNVLADLLADSEKVARSAAAKALGALGTPAAIALLRFKARVGDTEPEIIADCLTALVGAEPKESLPFVGEFLASTNPAIQEGAAFALAESRRPEACELLKAHWPRTYEESLQEVMLLAIALTRQPAALEFLLEILVRERPAAATAALSALTIHRHNEAVKQRIAAAVAERGNAGLQATFTRVFRNEE